MGNQEEKERFDTKMLLVESILQKAKQDICNVLSISNEETKIEVDFLTSLFLW